MRRTKITKSEAVAIAQAKCEALGWPWVEPAAVHQAGTFPPDECGRRHWMVKTNANVQWADPRIEFAVSFDGLHVRPHWIGETEPPE